MCSTKSSKPFLWLKKVFCVHLEGSFVPQGMNQSRTAQKYARSFENVSSAPKRRHLFVFFFFFQPDLKQRCRLVALLGVHVGLSCQFAHSRLTLSSCAHSNISIHRQIEVQQFLEFLRHFRWIYCAIHSEIPFTSLSECSSRGRGLSHAFV